MADRSAAALAELLLSDGAVSDTDALAAIVADDPPLLIWAVWVGWLRTGRRPRSVAEVSKWLAGNLLNVLQWDEPKPSGTASPTNTPRDLRRPEDDAAASSYADRVASALTLARLAAALATDECAAAADEAFLLGLLADVRGWLAAAGGDEDGASAAEIPSWLVQAADSSRNLAECDSSWSSAVAAVRLARSVLEGARPPPETPKSDPEAIRRQAEEGRQRWLDETGGLAAWLPQIAGKLARLANLEGHFHETLEAEKLEAMAEFAAGAGHEINNPLTVIAGRAQLFLHEETDPERRRALALMNSQAMRVYEMIADMMLFARPPRPDLRPVDLGKLADDLVADFQPRCARQETALRRTGGPGTIVIQADPVQLSVALRAICQNAMESLGSGGHIEINIEEDDKGAGVFSAARQTPPDDCSDRLEKRLPTPCHDGVGIRVSDDGPGIKPEERRHIFDPFYSARQAGRGLGLGLSKAWRIVTNHGGRIEVSSQPGCGTSFLITLPTGG